MKRIDFNGKHFKGFMNTEKLLLDTGILLALANQYDSWHATVKQLFEKFIFNESNDLIFLYINPTILNEITFLADRPLRNYLKKHNIQNSTEINPKKIVKDTVEDIKKLIENEVLLIADGNKTSTLKQIELYNVLGSADAANIAIANQHQLNLLTVDVKLSKNVMQNKEKVTGISKVYYTESKYRTH